MFRNISNATLAIGAAATAAGVFMIIFGGPKDSESAALHVHPQGASLVGRF